MNAMMKVLISTVNVAARSGVQLYIGPRFPLCNSDGIEWQDMTVEQRWDLCVAHLCIQDTDFELLLQEQYECGLEQCDADFILFNNGTALRMINAVQDECIDEVFELACVQTVRDIDRDIEWLNKQGAVLWDTLFEQELIITEMPRKN